VVQASSVISCSGTAASVNSCISSNLPNFQTQLDWAVFGTPDGTTHTGVWTASSGGLTIDVNSTGSGVLGQRVADNYASLLIGGNWVLASNVPGSPYAAPQHFDAPPDTTSSGSAMNPGNPGDHLIGLVTNGSSTAGQLLLNLSTGQQSLGFRIGSTSNNLFDATIQLFSGANQTGTMLVNQTFANLNGGGTCANLFVTNSNPPAPCNDAPFLAFLNFTTNQIQSVRIMTNDVDGFYIGNLQLGGAQAVPEPTSLIFCGCGVALLIIGKRQWKRRSS
jgi:hypothetical protein